jgi:hypothetical protein
MIENEASTRKKEAFDAKYLRGCEVAGMKIEGNLERM